MNDPVYEKATELRAAAQSLHSAIESQDAEQLLEALRIREEVFDGLLSVSTDSVSEEAAGRVDEILAIDQAAMDACREHMDRIRGELEEIRHARDVVNRQQQLDEGPRFVSRRA